MRSGRTRASRAHAAHFRWNCPGSSAWLCDLRHIRRCPLRDNALIAEMGNQPMNWHSPERIASLSRRQGLSASLLDALHESRRRQAARQIDYYRHLLDDVKVYEVRQAIEELTRERIPIWSFCRVRHRQFSWILLIMNRARAWMQAARLSAWRGPTWSRTEEEPI